MLTATPARDTQTTSQPEPAATLTLVAMTLAVVEEPPAAPCAPQLLLLPHPYDPTPEQTAAKKAKRRLSTPAESTARNQDGIEVSRPRYLNEAGFDAYGYSRTGQFDPTQRIVADPRPSCESTPTTTPFIH